MVVVSPAGFSCPCVLSPQPCLISHLEKNPHIHSVKTCCHPVGIQHWLHCILWLFQAWMCRSRSAPPVFLMDSQLFHSSFYPLSTGHQHLFKVQPVMKYWAYHLWCLLQSWRSCRTINLQLIGTYIPNCHPLLKSHQSLVFQKLHPHLLGHRWLHLNPRTFSRGSHQLGDHWRRDQWDSYYPKVSMMKSQVGFRHQKHSPTWILF